MKNFEEVKTLVGDRIKALRKLKKFSQEYVAHKTGLSESYISEIETGKINATLETLWRIAQVLEVEVSAFFVWEE